MPGARIGIYSSDVQPSFAKDVRREKSPIPPAGPSPWPCDSLDAVGATWRIWRSYRGMRQRRRSQGQTRPPVPAAAWSGLMSLMLGHRPSSPNCDVPRRDLQCPLYVCAMRRRRFSVGLPRLGRLGATCRGRRREVWSEGRMRAIRTSGSMRGCGNGATAEPLGQRQTKRAGTDTLGLTPPRHTSATADIFSQCI
jgi:hypothetical protein